MMTWYIIVCVGGESIVERSFNVDVLAGKMFLEVPVRQDRLVLEGRVTTVGLRCCRFQWLNRSQSERCCSYDLKVGPPHTNLFHIPDVVSKWDGWPCLHRIYCIVCCLKYSCFKLYYCSPQVCVVIFYPC